MYFLYKLNERREPTLMNSFLSKEAFIKWLTRREPYVFIGYNDSVDAILRINGTSNILNQLSLNGNDTYVQNTHYSLFEQSPQFEHELRPYMVKDEQGRIIDIRPWEPEIRAAAQHYLDYEQKQKTPLKYAEVTRYRFDPVPETGKHRSRISTRTYRTWRHNYLASLNPDFVAWTRPKDKLNSDYLNPFRTVERNWKSQRRTQWK